MEINYWPDYVNVRSAVLNILTMHTFNSPGFTAKEVLTMVADSPNTILGHEFNGNLGTEIEHTLQNPIFICPTRCWPLFDGAKFSSVNAAMGFGSTVRHELLRQIYINFFITCIPLYTTLPLIDPVPPN